ncbi:MAG: hypothetical protein IJ733_04635 [Lachnospiraceae bacterium]|nr:hypothetical protein [Lachnospiraceae bacterium]
MKKTKKHKKGLKWLLKHRTLITIFCIAIPLLIFVICFAFIGASSCINKRLENVYYISQIIAALFVIGGTVIAVWQYYLSSRSDIRQTQIIQVQKAIDLSEYYKDHILRKYSVVRYVYEKVGILDILQSIKVDDMVEFDEKELNSLLSPHDREELKKIQDSEKFAEAILAANIIYRLDLNINAQERINEETKEKTINVATEPLIVGFMSSIVFDLLNCMEFFALHFKHNTADSSVLYRSFFK